MNTPDPTTGLTAVYVAARGVERAIEDRDKKIREYVTAGHDPSWVARAAGLTLVEIKRIAS